MMVMVVVVSGRGRVSALFFLFSLSLQGFWLSVALVLAHEGYDFFLLGRVECERAF